MLDATSARVAVGGSLDEKTNYISPTLLTDVAPDDAIMKDEVILFYCFVIIGIVHLAYFETVHEQSAV